jgi:hypothetical protein
VLVPQARSARGWAKTTTTKKKKKKLMEGCTDLRVPKISRRRSRLDFGVKGAGRVALYTEALAVVAAAAAAAATKSC